MPAFLLFASSAGDAQVYTPRLLSLQCIMDLYRFLWDFIPTGKKVVFSSLLFIISAVPSSCFFVIERLLWRK